MTLDEFLQQVERRAYKTAMFATKERSDALDIVQDAMFKWLQAYSERDECEWPKLFQRVLQNRILDWHRARNRQHRLFWWKREDDQQSALDEFGAAAAHGGEEVGVVEGSGETPAALLACAQDIDCVNAVIESLPLRQQQAFLLRSWEGFDVEETANIMDCTKSSVKTHHARALAAIRAALEAQSAYTPTTK